VKFWIDENVPLSIAKALKQVGYETATAPRKTDDSIILSLALEANAVIITQDQDFERLVLKEGKPCNGIIWVRFATPNSREDLAKKLLRLVKVREKNLTTSFITISLYDVDIKKLKS